MFRLFLLLGATTALATSATAATSNPAAIALLEKSAEAMGGLDRIRDLSSLSYRYTGGTFSADQGQTPDEPLAIGITEALDADLANRRVRTFAGYVWPDAEFSNERRLALEGDAPWRPHFRELRRAPHLVLHFALQRKANARMLDAERGVVAVDMLGRILDVQIDPRTHLVRQTGFPFEDTRQGDATVVTEFNDYRKVDGWTVPGRIRQLEAGRETLDVPYEVYRVGHELTIDVPEQTADEGAAAQPEPSEALPLSEHTVLFTRIGQAGYNALVVNTDQGLVVIEAPLSPAGGHELRQRIVDHFGADRPIIAVAPTHHHGDHSGGLPGLVGPETKIVAVSENQAFFRDMVSAERSLLDWHEPVDPEFLVPDAVGWTIDGKAAVRLIDVGPSGHARNHLVGVVTDDKTILFQGDMAIFNPDGSVEPARDQGCALQGALDRLELAPDVIAGAHGAPGTPENLDQAVALRETPCPAGNWRSR